MRMLGVTRINEVRIGWHMRSRTDLRSNQRTRQTQLWILVCKWAAPVRAKAPTCSYFADSCSVHSCRWESRWWHRHAKLRLQVSAVLAAESSWLPGDEGNSVEHYRRAGDEIGTTSRVVPSFHDTDSNQLSESNSLGSTYKLHTNRFGLEQTNIEESFNVSLFVPNGLTSLFCLGQPTVHWMAAQRGRISVLRSADVHFDRFLILWGYSSAGLSWRHP